MKLLLRRDQRPGLLGKPVFVFEVRADLSPDEKAQIEKYRLGDTLLYQSGDEVKHDGSIRGFLASWSHNAKIKTICVRDLANGSRHECKSIIEMLDLEAGLKTAAERFMALMRAAANFGGEEVLEI